MIGSGAHSDRLVAYRALLQDDARLVPQAGRRSAGLDSRP